MRNTSPEAQCPVILLSICGHQVKAVGSSIEIDLCAKFSVQSDFESLHFISMFIQLILDPVDLLIDSLLISHQRCLRPVEW